MSDGTSFTLGLSTDNSGSNPGSVHGALAGVASGSGNSSGEVSSDLRLQAQRLVAVQGLQQLASQGRSCVSPASMATPGYWDGDEQ